MSDTGNKRFLLLISVAGLSAEAILAQAVAIHAAYMEEFGASLALTKAFLRLLNVVAENTTATAPVPWNYCVDYIGPASSALWLEQRIATAASRANASAATVTMNVEDLTDSV